MEWVLYNAVFDYDLKTSFASNLVVNFGKDPEGVEYKFFCDFGRSFDDFFVLVCLVENPDKVDFDLHLTVYQGAEVVDNKRTPFQIKKIDTIMFEKFVPVVPASEPEPAKVNIKKVKLESEAGKIKSSFRMVAYHARTSPWATQTYSQKVFVVDFDSEAKKLTKVAENESLSSTSGHYYYNLISQEYAYTLRHGETIMQGCRITPPSISCPDQFDPTEDCRLKPKDAIEKTRLGQYIVF